MERKKKLCQAVEKKFNRRWWEKTWHMFGKCEFLCTGKKQEQHCVQAKKSKLNNKWNFQRKKSFYNIIFFTLVCILTVFFSLHECIGVDAVCCIAISAADAYMVMDIGWYILPTENNNVFRCAATAAAAAYHYCCNNCADVMSILFLSVSDFVCIILVGFVTTKFLKIFYCWCSSIFSSSL